MISTVLIRIIRVEIARGSLAVTYAAYYDGKNNSLGTGLLRTPKSQSQVPPLTQLELLFELIR